MANQRPKPDPDERFSIEGDPEDALRGFLKTEAGDPEWRVVLAEFLGDGPFPEDAPDLPTGDEFLVFEWCGHAPSVMDAKQAAVDAWTDERGRPPLEQTRADIYRLP
jgi:hypothetical protein